MFVPRQLKFGGSCANTGRFRAKFRRRRHRFDRAQAKSGRPLPLGNVSASRDPPSFRNTMYVDGKHPLGAHIPRTPKRCSRNARGVCRKHVIQLCPPFESPQGRPTRKKHGITQQLLEHRATKGTRARRNGRPRRERQALLRHAGPLRNGVSQGFGSRSCQHESTRHAWPLALQSSAVYVGRLGCRAEKSSGHVVGRSVPQTVWAPKRARITATGF